MIDHDLRLRRTPAPARRGTAARSNFRSCQRRLSLSETLDRLLNKGAVIRGDIIISVADVDLIYLGVHIVLTSVETIRACNDANRAAPRPQVGAAAGEGAIEG